MAIGPFGGTLLQGSPNQVGNVTTAETTLGTLTLQAQGFTPLNSYIHVIAWGTTANNANAKTITVYFGSASQAFTLIVGAANSWFLEGYVVSAGSSSQDALFQVTTGIPNAATTESYVLSPTQNDKTNIVVKVTGTATATNDIVCNAFYVKT